MGAPLVVFALGTSILGAATVDVAAGARAEVAAGSAPIISRRNAASLGDGVDRADRGGAILGPRLPPDDPVFAAVLLARPERGGQRQAARVSAVERRSRGRSAPALKLRSDVQAYAGSLNYSLYASQAVPGAVTGTTSTGTVPTTGTGAPALGSSDGVPFSTQAVRHRSVRRDGREHARGTGSSAEHASARDRRRGQTR